jgi:hypothetical protein
MLVVYCAARTESLNLIHIQFKQNIKDRQSKSLPICTLPSSSVNFVISCCFCSVQCQTVTAEVPRCLLGKNSQTSKAEAKLKLSLTLCVKIYPVRCVLQFIARLYTLSRTRLLSETLTEKRTKAADIKTVNIRPNFTVAGKVKVRLASTRKF